MTRKDHPNIPGADARAKRRADLIGEIAWHSFAAGALCGLLGLGAVLPTVIPDGAHALCLQVESYTITLHVDPAACPPAAEETP